MVHEHDIHKLEYVMVYKYLKKITSVINQRSKNLKKQKQNKLFYQFCQGIFNNNWENTVFLLWILKVRKRNKLSLYLPSTATKWEEKIYISK